MYGLWFTIFLVNTKKNYMEITLSFHLTWLTTETQMKQNPNNPSNLGVGAGPEHYQIPTSWMIFLYCLDLEKLHICCWNCYVQNWWIGIGALSDILTEVYSLTVSDMIERHLFFSTGHRPPPLHPGNWCCLVASSPCWWWWWQWEILAKHNL